VELIGHRGVAAHAPENTLPSFALALSLGVQGVEWDVRVARCGTPVVFHDETLERTTNGTGPLASMTFEAMGALDAGGWFAPRFVDTRIPSLQEALALTLNAPASDASPSLGVRAYPELKAVSSPRDLDTIATILEETGQLHRITVISMIPALLHGLRHRLADLELGWVLTQGADVDDALAFVRTDPHALLDPDYRILLEDPRRTANWVREGISLVTWTVNRRDDALRLAELGVTRLTTDDPDALLGETRSR
jgi:glycerophosphoryl diester phosphodiesterase